MTQRSPGRPEQEVLSQKWLAHLAYRVATTGELTLKALASAAGVTPKAIRYRYKKQTRDVAKLLRRQVANQCLSELARQSKPLLHGRAFLSLVYERAYELGQSRPSLAKLAAGELTEDPSVCPLLLREIADALAATEKEGETALVRVPLAFELLIGVLSMGRTRWPGNDTVGWWGAVRRSSQNNAYALHFLSDLLSKAPAGKSLAGHKKELRTAIKRELARGLVEILQKAR